MCVCVRSYVRVGVGGCVRARLYVRVRVRLRCNVYSSIYIYIYIYRITLSYVRFFTLM